MSNKYSNEMWVELYHDHENGMSRRQLAEKYNLPLGTVATHLTSMRKKAQPAKRVCSHCGTIIDSPAMKFCWNCGADVRTEETLLLVDVKELMSILSTIPSSQVDRGMQIVLKIKEYLEKMEKRS